MSEQQLRAAAASAVAQALALGATGAECTLASGSEFSVTVRLGEVEKLKEADSCGAGLRVLLGQRQGSSYTSDLSAEGIRQMVASAMEIARITEPDPFAGLPEADELGQLPQDLGLASELTLSTAEKIDLAKRAEQAALAVDPRLTNSDGASFDSHTGVRVFANSRGFLGSYRSTYCSLSAVPVAKSDDRMERDYWYSIGRDHTRLESPEQIGRRAAERVLRRLGARKIATRQATVVFEPRTARSLVGHVFAAVTGDAIYRKSSFLLDKIGQTVAAPGVTIVDDPTLPGLFGSSPFDDEGVPGRRNLIIQNGVLETYLLHTYTARKLGLKTTGNASRGLTGSPGTGHGNLYLAAGELPPEELLRTVGTGLYVTELIGQGVNTVNGDYSRGASGIWIEDGVLTYPVTEVTVAGNLSEMLKNVLFIGNDLEFLGSTAAPTLAIGGMTISGVQ
jgi:PmbA protein